jgi:photosystem II stability/assembly factor-like uncharacterized protein
MKTFIILTSLFLSSFVYSQNSDWVYRNPLPQNDFYAIKFFDQNTGYVVGSNGIILKNTTGSNNWVTVQSNTINNLYGLYFFDVNTGYVVGAGGLIMFTSDGGNNWTHIVTSNGYALRNITFVNSNTGFLVGDSGELYKTTSGITGWVPINVTSANLHSVFFLNANTGFVGGDNGLLMKTTNSGASWISQTLISSSISCIYFTNQLTGFVSTSTISNYNNCLKTTDGGATWNPLSFWNIPGYWYSLSFINQDTGFIVGNNNLLMKTSSAGSSWIETNIPVQTTLLGISCVDTVAFICGTNGWIYETSYSGYFKNLGGTRNNFTSLGFISENTGCMIGGYLNLRTTNSGSGWDIKTFGYSMWGDLPGQDNYISYLSVLPPDKMYRIVHSYDGGWVWESVNESSDGGQTWYTKFSPGGGPPVYISIHGFDDVDGVAYVSMQNMGSTYIKKNSGSGWIDVYTGGSMNPGKLAFANPNTGLVLGGSAVPGYTRTTDGGTTWSFTPTGYTKNLSCLKFLADGTGFIAGDSAFLMRTYDYGANWTLLSNGGVQQINDINFLTDNVGWYIGQTSSYPPVKRLFFTRNGGTNFQQLQSLMNFNVNGFSFVDANTGYVCGDSGVVLKTTNGGLTFVDPTVSNIPDKYLLHQNYPNPFNPSTTIKFEVPLNKGGDRGLSVKLIVYDVLGREVATLLNEQLQPGSYSVDWDASNYPSGVYFYKLSVGSEQLAARRMVLVK